VFEDKKVQDFHNNVLPKIKPLEDATKVLGQMDVTKATNLFIDQLKQQEATFVCQKEFKKPPFLQFTTDPVKVAFEGVDRMRAKKNPHCLKAVSEAFNLFYWQQATDSTSLKDAMVMHINAIDVYGDKVKEFGDDTHKAWLQAFKDLADAFYEMIIEHKELGYIWTGKKNGGNAEPRWKELIEKIGKGLPISE
jgi:hypothetical protein